MFSYIVKISLKRPESMSSHNNASYLLPHATNLRYGLYFYSQNETIHITISLYHCITQLYHW